MLLIGAKGEKETRKKEPQPLELKIEQELPQSAKCLMDCEAADILQGIQEQIILLSKDPTIKIPCSNWFAFRSFDKGLQYTKRTSHYTNPQSVRKISVIANVCPETTDEVFALVPSLKVE
ncbi:RNA polymerase II, Rpb4, core protein [Prunus dulcis]|uniref:RNA polymerase II, Rpb4, core protein n=1 Tax=Prunus dulcis TaxID=3755 RepID=A0A4Y1R9U6_PRUDU|nr:RNA polymerase II, Rpb4, core protein [Prunus dulcis]